MTDRRAARDAFVDAPFTAEARALLDPDLSYEEMYSRAIEARKALRGEGRPQE